MFDDANLRKSHKKAVIIAVILMITPPVYVWLGESLLASVPADIQFPFYNKLRYFLWAAAAIEIIVISIVKKLIISGEIKIDTGKAQFHGKSEPKDNSPRAVENEFIRRLYRAFAASYAGWESIALIGFLLFFLGKNQTEFYALVGISLFLMLVHFPKYDDWESRLKDFLAESQTVKFKPQ